MSFVRSGNRKRTPPRRRSTRGSMRDSLDSNYSNLVDRFNDKNGTFNMSMSSSRRSVLSDNTDIEEPRRKTWWKNLGEHSRDVIEILESQESNHIHDIVEEYADVEVLSQERDHASLNFSDSSDSHVSSINIPHRRLFTQKENVPQNKFTTLFDKQDGMTTLQKTFTDLDNTLGVTIQPRKLFKRTRKQRTKSIFPTELLYASKSGEPSRSAMTKDDEESDDTLNPDEDSDVDISSQEQNRESLNSNTSHVTSINMPHRRLFTKKRNAPQDKVTNIFDKEDHTRSSSDKTLAAVDIQPTKLFKSGRRTKSIFPTEMLDESEDDELRKEQDNTLKDVEGANEEVTSGPSDDARVVINKSKQHSQHETEEQENEDGNAQNSDEEYDEMEELRRHVSAYGEQSRHLLEEETEKINNTRKDVGDVDMEEMSGPGSESGDHSKDVQEREESDAAPDMLEDYEMEDLRLVSDSDEDEVEDVNNQDNDDSSHNSGDDAEINEELSESVNEPGNENEEIEEQHEHDATRELVQDADNELLSSSARPNETVKSPQHSEDVPEVENEANKSLINVSTRKSNNADMEIISSPARRPNETVKSPQHSKDVPEVENEANKSLLNVSTSKANNADMEVVSIPACTNETVKSPQHFKVPEVENEANKSLLNVSTSKANNADMEDASSPARRSNETVKSPQHSKDVPEVENEANKSLLNVSTSKSNNADVEVTSTHGRRPNETVKSPKHSKDLPEVENEANKSLQNASASKANNADMEFASKHANKVTKIQDHSQHFLQEPEDNTNKDTQNTLEERTITENIDPILNRDSLELSDTSQVHSINIPHRRLFTQKNNVPQNINLFDKQSIASPQNAPTEPDDIILEVNVPPTNLFNNDRKRTRPIFPTDLLNISNLNKTKDATVEAANKPRTLFGNRAPARKNMFTDFIASESEAEISEIHPESESTRNSMGTEIDPESESTRNSMGVETNAESESTGNSIGIEIQNESESTRYSMDIETHPESESTRNSMNIDMRPESESTKKSMGINIQPESESTRNSMNIDMRPESESTRKSMGINLQHESRSIRNNIGTEVQRESESTRNSMGLDEGSVDSSGARSEWDSHRTLRKTMRKTFGKDFTPRKSLRTLIMEKAARRQTEMPNPINNETEIPSPAANSTEIHQYTNVVHSPPHRAPKRVQTTLEQYLLKLEQNNLQIKQRVQEKVKGYMNAPARNTNKEELYMRKPTISRTDYKKPTKQRPRKNFDLLGPLPEEFLEDVNYKPPKRYKPPNASWVTKKLYTFLEKKLEPKYFYKARVRAEKIVEALFNFNKMIKKLDVAPKEDIEKLKVELAKMNVVQTHFEFYNFIREFMPTEFRVKVIPDITNQLPLPPGGVFVDIASRQRLG